MTLRAMDVFADIPQAREFRQGIEYIIHLYQSCLETVQTETIKKVIIGFADKTDFEASAASGKVFAIPFIDVISLSIPFDFNAYWKASYTSHTSVSRKHMVLDALQRGLLELARIAELPAEPFEKAYQKVLERNIENTDYWYKPKLNPSRSLKANVKYDFGPYYLSFSVVLYDAIDNQIAIVHLDNLLPDSAYLYKTHWHLEWLNNETIQFGSKDGRRFWKIDVNKELTKHKTIRFV
jgi:hypothetical protein